jgi:DNA-binding CsgD family transcriptional regulator
MGDTLWTAQALVHHGIVAFGLRDLATAIARCEEGLTVYRQIGDKLGAAVGISGALDTLSLAAIQQDRHEDAVRLQHQALTMRADLGDRRGVALSLAGYAVIAASTGAYERAARLFGAADALREAVGWMLAHPESDLYAASLAQVRRRLPDDRFAAAWAAGRALSEGEAVAEALAEPLSAPAKPAGRSVPRPANQHGLTARELEVLRLIADGRSDREIADTLFISPRTVMRHVANVFAKLDIHSRGAAGAYARAHRLI